MMKKTIPTIVAGLILVVAGTSYGTGRGHGLGPNSGPVFESEPNDRLIQADLVGLLEPGVVHSVLARLRTATDADSFAFYSPGAMTMDLAVLTGASSYPLGTGLGDPDHVGSFDPLVMIFTDAGDLVFVHVGQGWSLLLLDLPLPPRPGWFVLQIRSASGEFGPYVVSVS